jgi:HEAT repeat protein
MMSQDDEEMDPYAVAYSVDNSILMHRDAHFGGSFELMLDYYRKGGKGISQDFEIERIQQLADMEKRTQKNLAAIFLSGGEAEKVAKAKQAYQTLRDLYEISRPKKKYPRLIADLILAEDEEEMARAIDSVVAEKGAIVPALVDLLHSDEFYDPLFPGYGQAPDLAAVCLGKIGDKRAIISLFEVIGEGDFYHEDAVLDALKGIGEPAKEFLLKVLHGRPLNQDNERAAIALVYFKNDPDVAATCLKMLQEIDISKNVPLATYLILVCEGLSSKDLKNEFLTLSKQQLIPKILQQDIQAVANAWSKE